MRNHLTNLSEKKNNEINNSIIESNKKMWQNLINSKSYNFLEASKDVKSKIIDPPDDCESYTITHGPFLETEWGQGCGYNSKLDEISIITCNVN